MVQGMVLVRRKAEKAFSTSHRGFGVIRKERSSRRAINHEALTTFFCGWQNTRFV